MYELNPYARRSASLLHLLRVALANRLLVQQLAWREVTGRYRGSIMGIGWSLINPLIMLLVYTFVFSVVFQVRWGGVSGNKGSFALVLFVGIIVNGIMAECVNRAPTLITSNSSYVKKVVFPLEVLPAVVMSSALFHAAISLLVLLIASLIVNGDVPITALALPLVLLPLVIGTLGVSWFLAAVGVYVRDLGQATGLMTTVLLFMSPTFYPIESLPDDFRHVLYLNPLTYTIQDARDVLLWGQWPDFASIGIQLLVSLALAWLGYWFFQRMRPGFADVI